LPRRRTHPDAPRSRVISIRIKEADYERLKLNAAWLKLTVSGLAERLVTKGGIKVLASDLPAPLDPALMAELKRVGNNLNQIAHAVNSNLPPDVGFTSRSLHRLIQLLAEDELLAQRLKSAAQRMKDDSAPPQAREEFQRRVHLHPARSEPTEL
jgi:hypothetical protein